ncbi:twin-arginine translocation signal domain-containing protein, partial [Streptomyces niveus]
MSTTPSRRDVLAGGTAIGGALAVGGMAAVPAQASAPASAQAPGFEPQAAEDSWRAVLDGADPLWRTMPATWFEG